MQPIILALAWSDEDWEDVFSLPLPPSGSDNYTLPKKAKKLILLIRDLQSNRLGQENIRTNQKEETLRGHSGKNIQYTVHTYMELLLNTSHYKAT